MLFLYIDIYKLNIQIQISLIIGDLYLAGLITGNIKTRKEIETYRIYEQASVGKKAIDKKEVPG